MDEYPQAARTVNDITDFLVCPECGSEQKVEYYYNNGRLRFYCKECLSSATRLVGKHSFRGP